MDRKRLIGRDNAMPWHLPADLAHFKAATLGKPIMMGRKTFESLGRPLPGRHNIVLTRDPAFSADGITVAHNLDQALAAAGEVPELMVIGGATLYADMLPRADRMVLTFIDAEFDGDAWFPAWPEAQWREVRRDAHPADERDPYPYSFVEMQRQA